MQDLWFPANEKDSKVVGRFIEIDTVNAAESRKQEREVLMRVLVLQSKVPGVSGDIAAQVVKPFNEKQLRERFPQAWETYHLRKAVAEQTPPPVPTSVAHGIKGMPIEEASFLGKDKLTFMKEQGFLTIEQVADMSDMQCQNLGFGAKAWRKKAKEQLAGKS